MDQPPHRILLKITALTFALGAAGCYIWEAQVRQGIASISSTKRPAYIFGEPAKQRISGTKSITQPGFATRMLRGETPWQPLPPGISFGPPPLDYPGYPPISEETDSSLGRPFKEQSEKEPDSADDGNVDPERFTSTKSGVPLIKVQPSKP